MEKNRVINTIKKEAPLWLFTLLAAYIITGLMLFLLAFLVYQFHLGERTVDIAIIVVYVVVNFLDSQAKRHYTESKEKANSSLIPT